MLNTTYSTNSLKITMKNKPKYFKSTMANLSLNLTL